MTAVLSQSIRHYQMRCRECGQMFDLRCTAEQFVGEAHPCPSCRSANTRTHVSTGGVCINDAAMKFSAKYPYVSNRLSPYQPGVDRTVQNGVEKAVIRSAAHEREVIAMSRSNEDSFRMERE